MHSGESAQKKKQCWHETKCNGNKSWQRAKKQRNITQEDLLAEPAMLPRDITLFVLAKKSIVCELLYRGLTWAYALRDTVHLECIVTEIAIK